MLVLLISDTVHIFVNPCFDVKRKIRVFMLTQSIFYIWAEGGCWYKWFKFCRNLQTISVIIFRIRAPVDLNKKMSPTKAWTHNR